MADVDDKKGMASRAGADLADENALLRASLADMRERLGELEARADDDPLTGLPGRRRFLDELARVAGLAERHGTSAALLHIGLDNLEEVRARHGGLAEDAATLHAARSLVGLIRSTDILACFGGGEFGLILDRLDHNSAIETADRLARCLAGSPLDLGGAEVALRPAIGVATILPGDAVDEVVGRARHNLEAAREG